MKKYIIKYEDGRGDVKCATVYAMSEPHAVSLVFAKEIYWVKLTKQ